MKICIINGPNLNLTGHRERDIYGSEGFDEFIPGLRAAFPETDIHYFQSNIEGEVIDKIQECRSGFGGIILNAGGYTHTSVAIGDAVKGSEVPVIEVHMSNVWAREAYRHQSFISAGARGVIVGFGLESYRLALLSFLKK